MMPADTSRLRPMREGAASLLERGDIASVRAMVARDGYVLVRGGLDREEVRRCRRVVCEALHREWRSIDTRGGEAAVDEARIADGADGLLLTGFRAVTHHPHMRAVLEGRRLAALAAGVLGASRVATFDQKWVRVHGRNGFTDEHTDFYRFKECAGDGMVTAWVPLGDYAPEDGVLAVCAGSHLARGMSGGRGRGGGGGDDDDDDDDEPEAKTELPPGFDGGEWHASDVRMGDVVLFDIRLVHASTRNGADAFRISADTRWRPAAPTAAGASAAGAEAAFREIPLA